MATDLETLMRAAVADGRLVNLTLWSTPQGWQANMSTGLNPWKVRVAADPVEALRQVLVAGLGHREPPSIDLFG